MSDRIKALLSTAAGPKGQGDEHWHKAGVDRLFFADPKDVNQAGQVDVARPSDKEPETRYVRVEAWVSPELAAEIIALVTGETQSLETRLRWSISSEMRMAVTAAPPADDKPAPDPAMACTQEAEDARQAEIAALAKEQTADDSDEVEDERAAQEDEVAA